MTIGPDSTVADAKAWLKARLKDGAPCPVCTQRAQTYRRRINAGAFRGLAHAYRTYGTQTDFHAPDSLARLGGEWARLALWGFIVDTGRARDDGGRGGWWRVTGRGERFLLGQQTAPKYVFLFDGRVMGWSEEQVSASECVGHGFDLRELLGQVAA